VSINNNHVKEMAINLITKISIVMAKAAASVISWRKAMAA
jgi:hypothetical protein